MSTATFLRRCVFGVAPSVPRFPALVHSAGREMVGCVALLLMLFPLSAGATPWSLGCQVNQTDGVSLKTGQSMIENTTNKVIAQGTVIEMTVQVVPGVGKIKFVTNRVAAPSTLQKHDKMSGGDTPPNGRSCTAQISLVQPNA